MKKIIYKIEEGATYSLPVASAKESYVFFIDNTEYNFQTMTGRVIGVNSIGGKWLAIYVYKTKDELEYIKEIERQNREIKQLRADILQVKENQLIIDKVKQLIHERQKFLSELDNAIETSKRERREIQIIVKQGMEEIQGIGEDTIKRISAISKEHLSLLEEKAEEVRELLIEEENISIKIRDTVKLIDAFRSYYELTNQEFTRLVSDAKEKIDNAKQEALKAINSFESKHKKAINHIEKTKDEGARHIENIAYKKANEMREIPKVIKIRDTVTGKPIKITVQNGNLDIE